MVSVSKQYTVVCVLKCLLLLTSFPFFFLHIFIIYFNIYYNSGVFFGVLLLDYV